MAKEVGALRAQTAATTAHELSKRDLQRHEPSKRDLQRQEPSKRDLQRYEPSKRDLQRQMKRTRESLAETIGEIKETVEEEYTAAKQTVSGVLDYREQFKNEPLVWSLGALSAGFALGYTVGYAHKNTKGSKQSPLVGFADSMVGELSNMGQSLVMPAITMKIKELFGFDFSELLQDMGQPKKQSRSRKTPAKRRIAKTSAKKAVGKTARKKSR